MKISLMRILLILGISVASYLAQAASVTLHVPVLSSFSEGQIFNISAYQDLNSYAGAPISGINVMAKNLQDNAPSNLTFTLLGAPLGPAIDILNYRIYSLFPYGGAVIPPSPVAATALQMVIHGQVQVDWVDLILGH